MALAIYSRLSGRDTFGGCYAVVGAPRLWYEPPELSRTIRLSGLLSQLHLPTSARAKARGSDSGFVGCTVSIADVRP